MSFLSVNPTTGDVLREYPAHSRDQVQDALALSARTASIWRSTSFEERGRLMLEAAGILEREGTAIATMLTTEMGKTLASAKGEVAKCATTMRYYASHSAAMLADESISSPASRSGVRYEPLGAVFAVMPWNFALWQVIRFAAPALMAGNVGILKHASNVPQAASFLETLFQRAGFPEGCFINLFLTHDDVPMVIADERVAAVTLTGSEGVGRTIAQLAGANLKKCVLELGGSDAFIVASSADLASTVPMAVTARIQNNGQSCIAAKRFIVVRQRADEFISRFVAGMQAAIAGDPLDQSTVVGPLATGAQRDLIANQVAQSVSAGATLLCGGVLPQGPGFFYPPTVLTDVPTDSPAGCEELFGPVAVVRVVEDLDEAIAVANDTPWGLGGSIWAQDASEIDQAIVGMEAGMVFANAIVASSPELPFGGIKNSGYGRELSALGIREFTNAKTFYVA
ncbi:MAG: NAD-dependent succinate-semialdehyde dehydrogenase [Acidimicrobiales bacterium]